MSIPEPDIIDRTAEFRLLLQEALKSLAVLPRTLFFENVYEDATVPMLRGVWGKALHLVDRHLYLDVFEGGEVSSNHVPKYLLRQNLNACHPGGQTAVDWILFGRIALKDPLGLIHAWLEASGMGLGPCREPFILRGVLKLGPTGAPHGLRGKAWPLSSTPWPLPGDPETAPCVLAFETPVKIKAYRAFQTQPTFVDICVRALDRVLNLAECDMPAQEQALKDATLFHARQVPEIPLQWDREHLCRYSGRQKIDLEYYGVVGAIGLPEGLGPLWPLLAALQWLHVGKGTTLGMGQVRIYSWE